MIILASPNLDCNEIRLIGERLFSNSADSHVMVSRTLQITRLIVRGDASATLRRTSPERQRNSASVIMCVIPKIVGRGDCLGLTEA